MLKLIFCVISLGEDSFFSKIIFFKPCLKKKDVFLLCNPGWLRTIQIHMPFLSNVLSARIEGICHHTRPVMYTLKYKFCLVHLQILVCLRAVEIAKQKCIDCSSKGHGFKSQPTYGSLQPSVTLDPGDLIPSSDLYMYSGCMYIRHQAHTHAHKIIKLHLNWVYLLVYFILFFSLYPFLCREVYLLKSHEQFHCRIALSRSEWSYIP